VTIVHVCQATDPTSGGAAVVARELVRAQRRLGGDARLLSLYGDAEKDAELQALSCRAEHGNRWTHGVRTLRRILREMSPDIIHHHDGLLWPRVASFGLTSSAVTHGHLPAPESSFWTASSITWVVTKLCSSRFIAISKPVANSWIDKGVNKNSIEIIQNGVNPKDLLTFSNETPYSIRRRLSIPENRRVLLWAGRLSTGKGIDRLCKLLEYLSSSYYVLILGDGPERPTIVEIAESNSLSCTISYRGAISNPAPYFAASDAFIFTSHADAFGLVLLEAAVVGLPIFSFPCVGGATTLLSRLNAITVSNEDMQSAAKTIMDMSLQRRSRIEISELCNEFSWETAARQCMAIYAKVRRDPKIGLLR
jgi:glycosyltransferase involved in cell wall biosynthesis